MVVSGKYRSIILTSLKSSHLTVLTCVRRLNETNFFCSYFFYFYLLQVKHMELFVNIMQVNIQNDCTGEITIHQHSYYLELLLKILEEKPRGFQENF